MSFALTARIAKSGRVVREYVQADASDLPPGSAFDERWELRAHARRDAAARPAWSTSGSSPASGRPPTSGSTKTQLSIGAHRVRVRRD